MQIRLLGVELFRADRRTDVKLTAAFSSCFADVPKIYIYLNIIPPRSNPGGDEIFRAHPDRPWGPPNLLGDANRTSITNTYCVYTVLRYSWWWTVDLSETCRVRYQI